MNTQLTCVDIQSQWHGGLVTSSYSMVFSLSAEYKYVTIYLNICLLMKPEHAAFYESVVN